MTAQEYKTCLEKILGRNLFLRKNALSIISCQYVIEKNSIGEEHICTYDLPYLWKEYALKLKKRVHFLDHSLFQRTRYGQ